MDIKVNTADDLPAAASAIAQTLIQVNTGIEQCQSGLDRIAQGETALLDAYDNLNSQAAISSISIGQPVNPNLHVGICGEHGGDPSSVEFCHKIGLDYVSCSPFRVPIARLAAAQAAIAEQAK